MAVHVLAVLAYQNRERVTSRLLAASVNTNPVIIRRLLLSLQKANLVETKKGAGFGSRLARPAAEIDLAEIYRAVEDDEPFGLPTRQPNEDCPVGQCMRATMEKVLADAQGGLQRALGQTTLADVLGMIKVPAGSPRQRAA